MEKCPETKIIPHSVLTWVPRICMAIFCAGGETLQLTAPQVAEHLNTKILFNFNL
jgi:hypothetical protein